MLLHSSTSQYVRIPLIVTAFLLCTLHGSVTGLWIMQIVTAFLSVWVFRICRCFASDCSDSKDLPRTHASISWDFALCPVALHFTMSQYSPVLVTAFFRNYVHKALGLFLRAFASDAKGLVATSSFHCAVRSPVSQDSGLPSFLDFPFPPKTRH